MKLGRAGEAFFVESTQERPRRKKRPDQFIPQRNQNSSDIHPIETSSSQVSLNGSGSISESIELKS